MPRRPELGEAIGRQHIYGDEPSTKKKPATKTPAAKKAPRSKKATAPAKRQPGRPRKQGPKWDELNERVTFHCPVDLHDKLRAAAAGGDRSKSQIIVDAIADHLA